MKTLRPILARLTRSLPGLATSASKSMLRKPTPRTGSPPHLDIADTIERALSAAGLRPATRAVDARHPPGKATPSEAKCTTPAGRANRAASSSSPSGRVGPATSTPAGEAIPAARGVTRQRTFGNAAGTRAYALYVPAGHDPDTHAPLPLLLMLHGCTQNPADFATGTRMNALADRDGVLVAWPAQTARDNGSRCWNWFRRQDQLRDAGEPSILAGIVADIAVDHRVDPRRVYVAGLSAGAAMAVILGRTYPDVFAAVGAHSGLPFGAAHDVPGAFAAMQGNAAARHATPVAADASFVPAVESMPTIVFHGDADRTVNLRNGEAIVLEAVGDSALVLESSESTARGRGYRRDVFVDARGLARVEHWTLHGGAHAWSGGDPSGSHVDAAGPDASAEMLRFFLQHARN